MIFSDDIFMGALSANGYPPKLACVAVIEAGIDCIMLSEKTFGPVAGVLLKKAGEDAAFREKIDRAVSRVIAYKIRAGLLVLEPAAESSGPAPAYTVTVNSSLADADFDAAAFEEAYSEGMEFYK